MMHPERADGRSDFGRLRREPLRHRPSSRGTLDADRRIASLLGAESLHEQAVGSLRPMTAFDPDVVASGAQCLDDPEATGETAIFVDLQPVASAVQERPEGIAAAGGLDPKVSISKLKRSASSPHPLRISPPISCPRRVGVAQRRSPP